jgi:hypothetical protein
MSEQEHTKQKTIFFYVDPFDSLIQANLSELMKITNVKQDEYIEQSIYRYKVTFDEKNRLEVESIIDLIKYYPVSIPISSNTESLKKFLESFLKTDIEGFERRGNFYYPFLKSGEYIYRSSDEIFHLKKYFNQRKNNAR